ncbi:MAG: 4Fe-4S dicluster domain-containing protein [Patescibacteria group bacterium]
MLVIEKKNLEKLLEELSKKSKTIDVRKNILPVKQYFLPPEEQIFPNKKPENEFILFGLSLRETEALIQLDKIMNEPEKDFFYIQKRNLSTIVSIIEEDGHMPHVGIDLILEKLNNNTYKATIVSEKGRRISKNKLFIEKNTPVHINSHSNNSMPELRKLLRNPELLSKAVEWSWKNYPKIWNELEEQCIGCGICTYVCPLCHCFSIENTCSLGGGACTRKRKWDACTLSGFAQISGGYNFHKTIKERYYNWFYHKFVRGYKEHGKPQCVACGKCKEYCPARIDIEKVLTEIVKKYEESIRT